MLGFSQIPASTPQLHVSASASKTAFVCCKECMITNLQIVEVVEAANFVIISTRSVFENGTSSNSNPGRLNPYGTSATTNVYFCLCTNWSMSRTSPTVVKIIPIGVRPLQQASFYRDKGEVLSAIVLVDGLLHENLESGWNITRGQFLLHIIVVPPSVPPLPLPECFDCLLYTSPSPRD